MQLHQALNWLFMPRKDVMVTKDCAFLKSYEWTPPDTSSLSPEQRMAVRSILNRVLLEFGEGWTHWFHKRKRLTTQYPTSEWPDEISRNIDAARRERFLSSGRQFDTRHYVSLQLTPPPEMISRLSSIFGEDVIDSGTPEHRLRKQYKTFCEKLQGFEEDMRSVSLSMRTLDGSDFLTFLKGFISTYDFKVKAPRLPALIGKYLQDCDVLPGFYPMIGDQHIRVLKLQSEPDETFPQVLSRLDELDEEYTASYRWMPRDIENARKMLEKRRSMLADQQTTLMQKLLSNWITPDPKKGNLTATSRCDEVNAALMQLESGDVCYGLWSTTIEVRGATREEVEDKVSKVRAITSSVGLPMVVARDRFMSTYLSQIPGHQLAGLDRLLGGSMKFADIIPQNTLWTGPSWNNTLDGPPLLRCAGENGVPFNFSFHQDDTDLSHTFIVGQSGAGKSTLLNTCIAAARRYRDSQVFVIGKKSASMGITLALGGKFHALGAGLNDVTPQPLFRVDDPAEAIWAHGFITDFIGAVTPKQEEAITACIADIAHLPPNQRTLSAFRKLIQDQDIKDRIRPLCKGGAFGDLLDGDKHDIALSDVTCFETLKLMECGKAIAPVLACVIHEIERCFNGRPTFVFIDEAGLEFDAPAILKAVRKWLKLARYANVTVVFATQSLADFPPEICTLLTESCANRIYTANNRAMERGVSQLLSDFGLSPEQISTISEMRPKMDYAFQTTLGWRVFQLGLTDYELSFVGKTSATDINELYRLRYAAE